MVSGNLSCGSSYAGAAESYRVVTSLPCSLLIPFFRVSKLTITSHRTPHTPYRAHDAGAPATTVLNNRQALKSQVAPTDGGVIPIKAHLKSSQMDRGQPYSHPRRIFTLARLRSAVLCARSVLFVLNVRRCDRRAHRTAFAHGIDRVCSGAFLHGASRALLHLRNTCDSLVSLTTVGLSACLFSQSRAAADQMQICLLSASLLSTPRASLHVTA